MNRLQKKCLFGSAAMHGLLAFILLIGPAFLSRKPEPFNLPQLSFIPTRTVDALLSGGGNPNARPPPPAAAPAPQIVQPQVVQPPPQPQPIEPPRVVPPQREPEPAPAKPQRKPKPEPEPVRPPEKPGADPTAQTVSKTSGIKVSTSLVKRPDKDTSVTKPKTPLTAKSPGQTDGIDPEAQRQINSRLRSSIRSIVQNLNDTLSSGTTIDIPGPGGEAFANYGQVVIAIYKERWIKPTDIAGYHVVKTTVVIGRDGRVRSHRIETRCGNPAVDRSVADVLDRVTFVAPFPAETKDESRTFTINFELNPEANTG